MDQSGESSRLHEQSASIGTYPAGTVALRVEQFVADSHQRGGHRVSIGRTTPAELLTLLRSQDPGRYRVSCLDARGRFIPGGALVIEIPSVGAGPRVVSARTSNDYPAPRSPLTTALRRAREAAGRVETLRRTERALRRKIAIQQRDNATQEAQHLTQRQRDEDTMRHLVAELDLVSRRVTDLDEAMDRRHRELRAHVEQIVAQLETTQRDRDVSLSLVMESLRSIMSMFITSFDGVTNAGATPDEAIDVSDDDAGILPRPSASSRPKVDGGSPTRPVTAMNVTAPVDGQSPRPAPPKTAQPDRADQLRHFLEQTPKRRT